ncbi:MAG: cytokinesis protein 3 [Icmadophila ericetorum]|nr:cytokinesis protein 3 [Icmadophila ericetorum]
MSNGSPTPTKPKKVKIPKPFQSYGKPPPKSVSGPTSQSRGPSPAPTQPSSQSRCPSPMPNHPDNYFQQPSNLSSYGGSAYNSRAPSPASFAHPSRQPSPNPYQDYGSSPPPPAPPPHRVAYNSTARRTPSPAPSMNDRYPTVSRTHTPAPISPAIHGLTPSPLRDAMDDVMSSLQDMAMSRNDPSPSPEGPLDPWSPEAFEELRTTTRAQRAERPRTSLGISGIQENGHIDDGYHDHHVQPDQNQCDMPPNLVNFVERMESRFQRLPDERTKYGAPFPSKNDMSPPAPPPKNSPYQRPSSSLNQRDGEPQRADSGRKLRNRKSAYELGRAMIDRTFTTKSTATNSSSGVQSTTTNSSISTQRTSQSLMSGFSAGGFSATSAGSLARRKGWGSFRGGKRPTSVASSRLEDVFVGGINTRPQTPLTGMSFHSSHESRPGSALQVDWPVSGNEMGGILGGLTSPKPKKTGFFKKLVDSAKTGAASARSSIASGQLEPPRSPVRSLVQSNARSIAGGGAGGSTAARDLGLGGGIDWVQVRRDINRSNSLSKNERVERLERCHLMNYPAIASVDMLLEVAEGDESIDGTPVAEPTNFQAASLALVDKNARFITSLPPMTNPTSLAQGYVCRPYRNDVQRLRAIFTWVSEKIAWEDDFEGDVDTRRVIQTKRGCAEEVAVLVMEMCLAVSLHAEVVRGYLKVPGEILDVDVMPRPNHWWNAVLCDGEWRIMDCSLASPTNPKRSHYSNAGSQIAETWWFLARPLEVCYTHIPQHHEQQHICPPISHDILLSLPCACPPYFKNQLRVQNYDTSLLRIENLEMVHINVEVPSDVECFAEVEARAYAQDADGDCYDNGDIITKKALAQAEWINGQKRYVVKALLPSDESHGVLKICAGKRGLMHSIKDNPHPVAIALPIIHSGQNPPYDFLVRHPTPHAQRHDLYVAQPQCSKLALNNTFVFAVRQHPSSLTCTSPPLTVASPVPYARPTSAMSMMSTSTTSNPTPNHFSQHSSSSSIPTNSYFAAQPQSQATGFERPQKPAKLAIQAPSGKILRLNRKSEYASNGNEQGDGGVWETIIKIGERGTWRGLVLADRSARWCVFGEWECV